MFINKKSNIIIYYFIFINIQLIFSQNCNFSNCLKDQGICISNTECKCINNFITFPIQKINNNNQKNEIFCNYERTSRWFPFLLELLLPSIGHIYLGKIKLGLFKLFLMIGPLIYLCIGHHFIDSVEKDDENVSGNNLKRMSNCEAFCTLLPIILSILSVALLLILYIFDLICYATAYYVDGNGIELV